MLQLKPGIHRRQDAENSEMEMTNLHILKRRLWHRACAPTCLLPLWIEHGYQAADDGKVYHARIPLGIQ